MGPDLSCFDGSRFFSLSDYGLPAAITLDVAEDASGAIWIGTENGAYRFWSGHVENVASGSAFSLVPISPDAVAAVTGPPGRTAPDNSARLVRIQRTATVWKAETLMNLDSPGPLTLDKGGNLLYPWPGKGWNEIRSMDVVRWHPGAPVPVTHHPVAAFQVYNGEMKVMRDRDGCTWLGAGGGSGSNLFTCDDGRSSYPIENTRLRANFHEASDGTMVLWGDSLLAIGHKGSFRVATPANGLSGVADALPASDGTVWLASSSGLYRFASPFRLEYWTAREGLRPAPWSVAKSAARMYLGVDQAIMVLSADRRQWDLFASLGGGGPVTSLLGTPGGSLLASAMAGVGIHLTPQGRALARTDSAAVGGMRLLRTPDGEIWLGGRSLTRLTHKGNTIIGQDHPLRTHPSRNVLAVKYEPRTRKLWACYNGGAVVRDENGNWREITTRDGLLVDDCWSLAPLPNGDVWYSYLGAPAIALIRTNALGKITVRQYGRSEGAGGTDALELDQHTRLWREGLYVADPTQAEAGNWMELNQYDGFPTTSINSGSFFTDPDGSLWWGADNDLVHYNPPPDLVTPQFSPNVFLSAFSWNGNPPKLAEAVSDLPHAATLTAHVGSLQFDRRNALRLRYRLLPDQPSWRETKSLDLPLGVLPSGAHTLEVQARIFTGPWSHTVRRGFSVLPPIWLTSRFFLFYLLAATLLFTSIYLLRRRRQWEEQSLMPDLGKWRLGALMPESHDLLGTGNSSKTLRKPSENPRV
jgi:ligand-binding sensor domain-containing protein